MFYKLKQYFYTYDPSHFSFYYTIKAMIAFSISVFLTYLFDLNYHIIFTVLSSSFIFYINVFDSTGLRKACYLSILIVNICFFIYFIEFFINIGIFFVIPTFFWVFLVGISQRISMDLFRVNIYSTIFSFSAIVFAQNSILIKQDAIICVLLGGGIAILFKTVSFYTYGAYTKKSFLLLLNDLEMMSKNLNDRDFDIFNSIFITHINQIKVVFKSKSVKTKDPSFIRHHNLAIFYLYKCEEISATLVSLRSFFAHSKSNTHLINMQKELTTNLCELKKIFLDKTPIKLQKDNFKLVKDLGVLPRLCDIMEVMFFKFELFIKGGEVVLKESKKDKSLSFFNKIFISIKNAFLNKECIRYSIKISLCVSLGLFIALYFQIDHGMWIAVGMFSLIKAKKNTTKIAILDTGFGVIVGLLFGFILAVIFQGESVFYFILFLSYFACIYFKHFPQTISMTSIMINLVLFLALIKPDFERLILFRIFDLGISLCIVLFVSYFVWPSQSEDDINPSLLGIIDKQTKLLNADKTQDYITLQSELTLSLRDFASLIAECQNKQNYFRYHKVLQNLGELNSCIMSLHSYLNNIYDDYKTSADIRLISTRFDMIKNMIESLPFYFYDEIRSKLSSQNPKTVYFLLLVLKKQDELYKNIKAII